MTRPGDGVVWITGASAGIGRALALRFARAGYRVAASARGAEALASLAAEAGGRIEAIPLDVTDGAAMRQTVARLEPISLAVLNAGSHSPMGAADFSVEKLRRLFEVNVFGVAHGLEAVLPGMLARRAGKVAIVASVAGYRGLPTAVAYGATKAALINMAEALKLELEGTGVSVALVCPGFVDTPLTAKNDFPMPFLMRAEDAAERMFQGLLGDAFEIAFPRRFTWMLKTLRLLPYALYFPAVRRATRR
jgi:short-subunit dehydrogenase